MIGISGTIKNLEVGVFMISMLLGRELLTFTRARARAHTHTHTKYILPVRDNSTLSLSYFGMCELLSIYDIIYPTGIFFSMLS